MIPIITDMTIKQLINILLDHDMNKIIVLRDKDKNELHDITISIREQETLAALFG